MAERRHFKRYVMPRGTLAILRKTSARLKNHSHMSIGEIAMVLYKTPPEAMWPVKDIGLGGVAFGEDIGFIPDDDRLELDLLMTEQGVYVHNIPFVTVAAASKGRRQSKRLSIRTDALRFAGLGAAHQQTLQKLLTAHGDLLPSRASSLQPVPAKEGGIHADA